MEELDSKSVDLLHKYVSGVLSSAEQETVQQRIQNDPVFRKWHDLILETGQTYKKIQASENKESVKKWLKEDREHHQVHYKKQYKNLRYILLALLFAASAGLFYILSNKEKVDPIEYASAELNIPYKDPIILRSDSADFWQKAIPLYANGNYNDFIKQIQPSVQNNEASNEQLFYFALANLYKKPNDCQAAIGYFTALINKTSGYEDVSLWFRALAKIKCDNVEDAKKDLEQVVTNNKFKAQEAKEILDNL